MQTEPARRLTALAIRLAGIASIGASTVLVVSSARPALAQTATIKDSDAGAVAPKVESLPPIAGPRELLGLYGVDESYFTILKDGRPVGQDENEALIRMLYAVRKFPLSDLDRWTNRKDPWTQFAAAPSEHRGQIVAVRGRARRVTVEKPIPEVVERFELAKYYRVDLELEPGAASAVIYTPTVPKAWKIGAPLDERVSAQAFFLKLAGEGEAANPVFAAQRVAWYPGSVLGDLEMDVGLYDDVKNRTGISGADRECFYQLLAAAGRAGTQELLRRAPGNFSVVPLFNQPDKQQGQIVALTGLVRRAIRIRVEDPDVVSRFGIDHYYEIELFTEDSQNNPVVFCVRHLPVHFPTGENVQEQARIAGFFFKTWGYRLRDEQGDAAARPGAVRNQLAPLLIGREPAWILTEKVDTTLRDVLYGGVFVVCLIGLWIVVRQLGRGDARFRKQTLARQYSPQGPDELASLGEHDRGGPDFRDWGR